MDAAGKELGFPVLLAHGAQPKRAQRPRCSDDAGEGRITYFPSLHHKDLKGYFDSESLKAHSETDYVDQYWAILRVSSTVMLELQRQVRPQSMSGDTVPYVTPLDAARHLRRRFGRYANTLPAEPRSSG